MIDLHVYFLMKIVLSLLLSIPLMETSGFVLSAMKATTLTKMKNLVKNVKLQNAQNVLQLIHAMHVKNPTAPQKTDQNAKIDLIIVLSIPHKKSTLFQDIIMKHFAINAKRGILGPMNLTGAKNAKIRFLDATLAIQLKHALDAKMDSQCQRTNFSVLITI